MDYVCSSQITFDYYTSAPSIVHPENCARLYLPVYLAIFCESAVSRTRASKTDDLATGNCDLLLLLLLLLRPALGCRNSFE